MILPLRQCLNHLTKIQRKPRGAGNGTFMRHTPFA
jgi:hypothetical protein